MQNLLLESLQLDAIFLVVFLEQVVNQLLHGSRRVVNLLPLNQDKFDDVDVFQLLLAIVINFEF